MTDGRVTVIPEKAEVERYVVPYSDVGAVMSSARELVVTRPVGL
jgi:hypothetical protein